MQHVYCSKMPCQCRCGFVVLAVALVLAIVAFLLELSSTWRDTVKQCMMFPGSPIGSSSSALGSASAIRRKLWLRYNDSVTSLVRWNSHEMGCSDQVALLATFRAIANRLHLTDQRVRVFVDVGANIGDDADGIVHSFFGYHELCTAFAPDFFIVSLEASPFVFCTTLNFTSLSGARPGSHWIGLNAGLSSSNGVMPFLSFSSRSGGGRLVLGKKAAHEGRQKPLSKSELERMRECRSPSIDTDKGQQVTQINVFTLDFLYSSLATLGMIPCNVAMFGAY
eukprot:TRINITY_DN20491_c0_g1_i2.p1 TRINITY_DN20491_c0_g1~~TRINITY_DN20491_c0_g1_i2.p1  ORF type:complete len:292 (-),score=21.92 TRINITY_DN20491_c0_g1_i2:116-955(-)